MNRDEAFLAYEQSLALITEEARLATERAKSRLHEQLKALRDNAHAELKAIRTISQKTK